MDNWVLVGPKRLEKQKQSELPVGEGKVKVKVTHVLLSNYDAALYSGEKAAYPKTIGRFAIGLVMETGEKCYGIKAGKRVYLNAVRPCEKCYNCRSGNKEECTDLKIAGKNAHGFLRDFVVCDYTDVAEIPDSVDDMHALCIECVALADNIFDKLNLSTGSNVAIIGAGFFGSILAQIAFYYKLVPIVIDNNAKNIERLKRSGAFFSFAADENLAANIANATSSKLCDAAIYSTSSKLSPTIPASVVANKKDIVLGGFCPTDLPFSTGPMHEKGLRMYALSDGYGYTESAINMLVHGAIDLSNFEKEILTEFDVAKLLDERAAASSYTAKMTVLKLVL